MSLETDDNNAISGNFELWSIQLTNLKVFRLAPKKEDLKDAAHLLRLL